MRILIAEDDLSSRRILESALQKWGYEVISVSDGIEAWNILNTKNPPTLIILDWVMPGMDGLEVIRKIRTANFGNYIFVILLTAKSHKEDIVHGIEAGADDYLTKPFDRDELLARMRAGERIINLEQTLAQKNNQLRTANFNLSTANYRMKKDLEAAAEIQKILLPNNVPKIPGINIEWLYKPCEELAGDILNVFMLDEKHLGLYLLDVSGHGVSAALLSVTLSRILSPVSDDVSFLRVKAKGAKKYLITPPAEVACKLNKRFMINDESGQYFTLVYGILNLDTLVYRFISAGHPTSLLISGNNILTEFHNTGLPIGFDEDAKYVEKTIQLSPGDRLFVFSDGINEALNNAKEQFGMQRFVGTLQGSKNKKLKPCLNAAVKKVNAWSDNKLNDDISILAIEMTP